MLPVCVTPERHGHPLTLQCVTGRTQAFGAWDTLPDSDTQFMLLCVTGHTQAFGARDTLAPWSADFRG